MTHDAARRLGVGLPRFSSFVTGGRIAPVGRSGRFHLYRRADVDELRRQLRDHDAGAPRGFAAQIAGDMNTRDA